MKFTLNTPLIDAMQWTGDVRALCEWAEALPGTARFRFADGTLYITTNYGERQAIRGEWIALGRDGWSIISDGMIRENYTPTPDTIALLQARARASVISSASPLSEEERRTLVDASRMLLTIDGCKNDPATQEQFDTMEFEGALSLSEELDVIRDRLSASAPSPEGAPAEPTLVVGFNRETGNPNVGARSVETSDFCAACVRGYCEDRYSIRECRGHWHVTMCGADLAIPGDPFASAEIAQRAADAENRGRDPGGEA